MPKERQDGEGVENVVHSKLLLRKHNTHTFYSLILAYYIYVDN